jgi:hypothetical protein
VAIIYITQCAENIIIHNIIQMCTLFDLYIINVQKILQTCSLHLTMSATPPVGAPGNMSVTNLFDSMQLDMTNVPTPATAGADLQGNQLLYYEEHISGASPAVKVEREGGFGTFVLPGGINGVPLVLLSCGLSLGGMVPLHPSAQKRGPGLE